MKKILFVCLGNICRSPGAEAIMKAWIKKEGKEKEFLIDSAGLYSGHAGALPDERMRRHASRRGYVLDSRARTFYPTADFAKFDMIIGMDDQNIEALKRAAINEEERAKIFKMTDFCRKSTILIMKVPKDSSWYSIYWKMRLPDFIGIVWPIIDPDI